MSFGPISYKGAPTLTHFCTHCLKNASKWTRYGLEDCFLPPISVYFQVSSSYTIVFGLFVVHRRRRPHTGIDLGMQFIVHTLSHLYRL
jgi:hypothetical protein